MFRVLKNECIIRFQLEAKSPISIRSGESIELDPTLPDNQFIRSYQDGVYDVVIPGSSIKGVFRNRVERLLEGSCNVFDKTCFYKVNELGEGSNIQDKYKASCPACRLFGSMALKSRVEFKDAFPVKDTVRMSTRYNVAIDRVTGAAKKGALVESEVLEEGVFNVEIVLRNFFLWQLKAIFQVFLDINEGYVSFGGMSSRGLGRMAVKNVDVSIREYGAGREDEFYQEKHFTLNEMLDIVKDVPFDKSQLEKVKFDEHIL